VVSENYPANSIRRRETRPVPGWHASSVLKPAYGFGDVMISWFLIGLIVAIPAALICYSGPSNHPPWLFRGFFLLIFLIFVLTALLS
jgi:hypothetical protein